MQIKTMPLPLILNFNEIIMIDFNLLKKFNIAENLSLEELKEVLVQKEKSIIAAFFSNSNMTWENDLSGMRALTKLTPWSGKEMNSYYGSRQENDKIKSILTDRRREIISENFLTFYDDYQIVRVADDKKQLDETKEFSEQLSQLSDLGALFAQANPDVSAISHDTYYLSILFRVLDVLRLEMTTHEQQHPSSPNPYLISRIDAVNRLLASYLLNLVMTKKVDEYKELIGQIFKAIGSQDQEVLPWLSVFFKRELLMNSEERDQLIKEFLKLSHLKWPTPIAQQLLEVGGQRLTPAIDKALTEYLKHDANVWSDLANQRFEDRLKKIEAYLLNSYLSDWVMLNICMNLIAEAKSQPQHTELSRVVYLCCRRVYQDQHVLEQAYGYLSLVNRDIENKYYQPPALSVATISDINMASEKAFELNIIPPSTEIFYEMIKNPERLITLASTYDKASLIKLLSTIFIDGNQLEQHLTFIDSVLAQKMGLHIDDFPLMALRKHYVNSNNPNDPIPLWEAVLDSGMIMQSAFLAAYKNERLFAMLEQVGPELIDRDKICSYPERYKELCLALAVYCTLNTSISPGFLFIGPHLQRNESVAWASKLFMDITHLLPQNAAKKVELRKVLSLLGMTIEPPNQSYIEEDDLGSKLVVSALDAKAQKPGVNPTYTIELLCGIIFNYMNELSPESLTPAQVKRLDLFPKCHLPAQLFQIMAAAEQSSSTAIPEFLPYTQKIKILQTITAQEVAKAYMKPLQALYAKPNETADKRLNQERKELFALIQLYLEYCQQELTQNNQLQNTEKRAYNNFVFYWTNPIVARVCERVDEMDKYLEKETDGILFFDFLDKKTQKQVSDWTALKDKMRRCFLNVTNAAQIQLLILAVNPLIETHSGQYAKSLKALRVDLCSLEEHAKKYYPETVSKFDEEKCVNALKTIKEECEHYQKHLTGITRETPSMHNVERIQKANNKLSDLQNMLKFDESQIPSAQLIEFNRKFEAFKQKYVNPDPDIETENVNTRFWRRIAYALCSVGIYALVRGVHLGTFHFWKSHKEVLSDTIDEASEFITPKSSF
jgi:hypothetical protein